MNNTNLLYLKDSYLQTTTALVIDVVSDAKEQTLILDQSIFYAQGGGQPADTGTIVGQHGSFSVTHVSYNNGVLLHKGKLDGKITKGDQVQLTIDWPLRYYHMQLHTAGHLLDQAVKNIDPQNYGVDGDHGIGKRNFVSFVKEVTPKMLPQITQELQQLIAQDLKIVTQMTTKQKLTQAKISLPFKLPENKDLRIVQIGQYMPMPDGGTHLKSTGEAWPIEVTSVQTKKGQWRVQYQVFNPNVTKVMDTQGSKNDSSNPELLQPLTDQIKQLKTEFLADSKVDTATKEQKYLGKKGQFNDLAKEIKNIDKSVKKQAGQALNHLKEWLQTELQSQTKQTKLDWVDVTKPGPHPNLGHVHPVSQAMAEITHVFEKIGFQRVRYPEIDWDWYVFESLNMPPDHPARDEWETFFVDLPDSTDQIPYDANNPRSRHPEIIGGKVVMSTHTSNGQVREMERLGEPPIRMINISRCYRRQQDATHTPMFHQFEGLVIDKNITIQHLKGTLDYFAKEFFGPDVKSRIRPFHFRFTEPSFEVDFSCHICHGTGQVKGEKCKFCKSGWHEVGGAGMVHPNVLKAGNIDPEQYTGFAFGWGIERTYTLKPGLNIDDIRLLYSGEMRFLEQF